MFPLIKKNEPNTLELFQIWLNLPSKDKMVNANYKMLWSETIPIVNHKDKKNNTTTIEVIAGKIENHKAPSPTTNSWANNPENEVAIWNIKMEPNASYTLPKTLAGINRTLYLYESDGFTVSGQPIKNYHSVELNPELEIEINNGDKPASILILQGKPIGEPVVQHGPFVMNTKEEIQKTFADYQRTEFGGWPWPTHENVHDRTLGRFAKHSNGETEYPG